MLVCIGLVRVDLGPILLHVVLLAGLRKLLSLVRGHRLRMWRRRWTGLLLLLLLQ